MQWTQMAGKLVHGDSLGRLLCLCRCLYMMLLPLCQCTSTQCFIVVGVLGECMACFGTLQLWIFDSQIGLVPNESAVRHILDAVK
ncbi:unnamed protein product, partial [Ostreobium quekettii]